jgi:ketosteroid isomerase-like protein
MAEVVPESSDQATESVRALIARINAAWRQNRFDGLDKCFHPDALIVGPDYRVMARGCSACIDSYREFANDANVVEYSEADHAVTVWGTTAVCTYSWVMTYRRADSHSRDTGTDQFVCSFASGRWVVVWRAITLRAA